MASQNRWIQCSRHYSIIYVNLIDLMLSIWKFSCRNDATICGFCYLTSLDGRYPNCRIFLIMRVNSFIWQTISYMAERVVGHGSFGIVFQVGLGCLSWEQTLSIVIDENSMKLHISVHLLWPWFQCCNSTCINDGLCSHIIANHTKWAFLNCFWYSGKMSRDWWNSSNKEGSSR